MELKMKTYEFDVVTDEISLEQTIENLFAISGIIAVETLSEANDANGWPTIRVTLIESDEAFAKLAEIFPDYAEDELVL